METKPAIDLRKTGISVVGDVPWGTHFCHFYETKQDLLDTLVPYFKAGLESNEFCLWVVSDSEVITVEEAKRALAEAVPELDRHLSEGNIEIFKARDWYLERNELNLDKVTNEWIANLKRALARGYAGLRVSGDTFWLTQEYWKDFRGYEKQLNESISDRRMTILCTYALSTSRASDVLNVLDVHQFATSLRRGDWQFIQSPGSTQAKSEIKRLNEELQRSVRKTTQSPLILRYGVAVLAVAAALIINQVLDIHLVGAPAMLFLCALMFSALYGGVKPSLLAMPLAVLAFAYYFVTPTNSWTVDVREIPRLLLFVLSSLFVISLSAAQKRGAESLRQARDVLIGTVKELKRTNQALRTKNTERKQAERALKESQRTLQEAQRIAHVGHFEHDLDTGVIVMSDENYRILGLQPQESITVSQAAGLVHPADRERLTQVGAESMNNGCGFTVDYRIVRPHGEVRFIHSEGDVIRDEQGRSRRRFGIMQDVTERKIADEELKKEKEILEKIFDNIPVMIGFVGEDGVKLVNPRWERTIGWTLKELREQKVDIFVEAYPDPSYRQEVLDFVAASTGEWVDLKIKVRDGRVIDAACVVVRLSDGTRVAIAQDITERKQAEEALRRSENQLRLVIDTIPTLTWTVRPDGTVDFLSRRWMDYSGLSLEEFVIDPTAPIHPEDRDSVLQKWRVNMAAGEPYEAEMRLRRTDGAYRWFLVRTAPLRDEEGNVVKWYGVSIDIEDRKRAEALLHAKEQEFRAIVENAPDQIIRYDRDFRRTYVNPAVAKIYDLPMEALIGKPIGSVIQDTELDVKDDEVASVRQKIATVFDTGESCEYETSWTTPAGRRHYSARLFPEFDLDGSVISVMGIARDITQRKEAIDSLEKALLEINALKDQLYKENVALREEITSTSMFEDIVGTSPALQGVLGLVGKVAPTDSTVLITGETGTGKELVARAIHNRSSRAKRPFVAVHCAAIPPTLIASELFGHEKGSFTGAIQQRLGRFELAEGGTIFLDEIGELPHEVQIALLRVLQEHEFERVGGTKTIRADVRVIAATNRDLHKAIDAGEFRNDLFYRLNVFPIDIPPLRERKEDIPALVEYFIHRYTAKTGKKLKGINKQTLTVLESYDWPGNIRELQNVIERSLILGETENFSVDKSWLPQMSRQAPTGKALLHTISNHEKEMIEAALAESHGQVSGSSGAAARLGIPASTLDSKIRRLKINKHRFRTS